MSGARDELAFDTRFLRRLESLSLFSRGLAHGSERGERRSTGAGSGVAFSTHRLYAPGDDFRFVDWKAYARSDRLHVKQFEEERDLTVHFLLDCSASMAADAEARPSKLAYAKQLAAALGYVALVNLDRVSVLPFADAPRTPLAPLRGRNRALILLRYLAALQAAGGTDLAAAARALRVHASARGLSIVLSDGFDGDGLVRGVDLLRFARLEPVVLLVRDPRDASPALRGPLTLVDRETGAQRDLRVDDALLARYRTAYEARATSLLAALHQRKVRALSLSIDVPFERAVLGSLRRAGVVA